MSATALTSRHPDASTGQGTGPTVGPGGKEMDNTNVRVITQEPTTSTIASSFIRSEQVRISVTIDQMTQDWIGIHAQAGDYSVVQSIYMPLQAAESVAFQIQSLVQERMRGNP